MAWLKVECSVARNRKFMKAGPAPSWLWLCGLAYCQEGQTDGFIPFEALPFLGVKNAKPLAGHLEKAGLWHRETDGWKVHDYLDHNKSAEDIDALKAKRGAGGKLGGRPKKNLHENLQGSSNETLCETFPVAVAEGAAEAGVDLRKGVQRETAPQYPMDEWWLELTSTYPGHRSNRSDRVNKLFVDALLRARDGVPSAWARMRANLAQNIVSHEWAIKGMAPALGKYLEEGLWENVWPASAPVGEQLSPKTSRTLAAAADIIGGKA